MQTDYFAIRNLASIHEQMTSFKKGDVLVLFGELFQKGYATGLVEEAEKKGMLIVRSTVGRREKDGTLRPLNQSEIEAIPQPFINVPLEAGFDLENNENGEPFLNCVKDVKLSEWESIQIPKESLRFAQEAGRNRFKSNLKTYLKQLETLIPAGSSVLFAHLMAGGVPRTKIIMPLMNRSVKGTGERFLSSEKFWNSSLGQMTSVSFNEVTAETFRFLVEESTFLREKIESSGGRASYLAYGYHGTEVLVEGKYVWQSYSPYVQGWAKKQLENYSRDFFKKGIQSCVYNCPEILTQSSAIFSGVEVSLYPLIFALKKEGPHSKKCQQIVQLCQDLLKDNFSLQNIESLTTDYLQSDLIKQHCHFEKWPQHNSQAQLEKMLGTSEALIEMHKDSKQLITYVLSEAVFAACGKVMLTDSAQPQSPVAWINHDVIAKIHASN